MPPLDAQFPNRTRQSSLLIGSILLLPLFAYPSAAWSMACGIAAAWLIWTSAMAIGGAYNRVAWRARDVVGLVLLYAGKYALIAALVWWLQHSGRLSPVAFTVGFTLPLGVLVGKVCGRLALPEDVDPVPVYARPRKVATVE